MAQVTNAEVDQAFYDAHRDASGKIDPALVDPATGKPRKLINSASDKQFVQEWVKIRKHLQEVKNCAAPTGGAPVGETTVPCPAPVNDTDAPPLELSKWNDGGTVQLSTNCYAYAMNSRTGHTIGETRSQESKRANRRRPGVVPRIQHLCLLTGSRQNQNSPIRSLVLPNAPIRRKTNCLHPKRRDTTWLRLL